ncbi:hypothetical protein SCHPADRAFT_717630 [Schizopora paradoxa]|uniref:Uncharacterized protein n=1 Tax=Schizopora paradoxa TaxID=27342 RepID=A0A0H2R1M3_9AGAM|nr:hypothetical protein SCHPADRAFT_717630 [Schizopora paradoxa]
MFTPTLGRFPAPQASRPTPTFTPRRNSPDMMHVPAQTDKTSHFRVTYSSSARAWRRISIIHSPNHCRKRALAAPGAPQRSVLLHRWQSYVCFRLGWASHSYVSLQILVEWWLLVRVYQGSRVLFRSLSINTSIRSAQIDARSFTLRLRKDLQNRTSLGRQFINESLYGIKSPRRRPSFINNLGSWERSLRTTSIHVKSLEEWEAIRHHT